MVFEVFLQNARKLTGKYKLVIQFLNISLCCPLKLILVLILTNHWCVELKTGFYSASTQNTNYNICLKSSMMMHFQAPVREEGNTVLLFASEISEWDFLAHVWHRVPGMVPHGSPSVSHRDLLSQGLRVKEIGWIFTGRQLLHCN